MAQTAETLAYARNYARNLDGSGCKLNPRVVSVSLIVGGRASNPDKRHFHGVAYEREGDGTCIQFWPDDYRDDLKACYVVDGRAYFVAGWQNESAPESERDPFGMGYVLLHPDTQHVLDMPMRTYFMRTTTRIPALNGERY